MATYGPSVGAILTLTTGSTGMIDMAMFTMVRPNLRLEASYNSAPSGQTIVDMTDGFGGYRDPAITYPWVQPLPLATTTDGTHPCTTVAWNTKYTNYPLSALVNSGQTLTVSFSRTQEVPPWAAFRIFNNSGVTATYTLYVANQSY